MVCVCVRARGFARQMTVKCEIVRIRLLLWSSIYAVRFCYNIEKMYLPYARLVIESDKNKNHWRDDANLNFVLHMSQRKELQIYRNKETNKPTYNINNFICHTLDKWESNNRSLKNHKNTAHDVRAEVVE